MIHCRMEVGLQLSLTLVCPLLRTVLSSKQFNVDYVREITRRSSVEDDVMRVLVRHLG